MLPADRPSSCSQRGGQLRDRFWLHRQFGDANRQARGVLDADVLDVDARFIGCLEEPGELTRPVRNDDLDDRKVAGWATALARNPRYPGATAVQELGQFLNRLLITCSHLVKRSRGMLQVGSYRTQHLARRASIPREYLQPHAGV